MSIGQYKYINNVYYYVYMYQGCRKQRKANILKTYLVRKAPTCTDIPMIITIHTMVAPRDGLVSITFPSPASCSNLNALTAPSLFPLSRKRLAFNRALRWRIFPGRRRQYAATEWSCCDGLLFTCAATVRIKNTESGVTKCYIPT